MEIEAATDMIRRFVQHREWEQFHTPKNLLLAMTGEVGELASEFQWLSDDASTQSALQEAGRLEDVAMELADVAIYLLRLADVLEIDLGSAIERKVAINDGRYPADRARGTAAKYTEL